MWFKLIQPSYNPFGYRGSQRSLEPRTSLSQFVALRYGAAVIPCYYYQDVAPAHLMLKSTAGT